MNVMSYKGYQARVEFDAEDGLMVGHIAGINDVVGFHADNVSGLTEAFHEAVDDYVETCAAVDKAPEKPYSGKVMFRIDPEVHAKAALAAQLDGVSLNQWAEMALREKVLTGMANAGIQAVAEVPTLRRRKSAETAPALSARRA